MSAPLRVGAFLVLVVMMLASVGCFSLPSQANRRQSFAFTDTHNTVLGRAITPEAKAHPGQSGLTPLIDGSDAFAARVALVHAAQKSLDVQNYIWRNDLSGTLLFDELRHAADRGVRVRLLLDDNNTKGLDDILAALAAHPMIQVRLFNPFVARRLRWMNYPFDFSRLNRRMHNKSFTADNQATIIGGRNIGDEYFEAAGDLLFIDLDVLAVGSVVKEVSKVFDDYWACASSYPVGRLLKPVSHDVAKELAAEVEKVKNSPRAKDYVRELNELDFMQQLLTGGLPRVWAKVTVIADDPAKGLGKAADIGLLTYRLWENIGQPKHSLDLVSPYFVPTKSGVESFSALAKQGVKIRILTNSLEATDVPIVHSGYAKRRPALLEAGIDLYEIKSTAKRPAKFFKLSGSSTSSLHAKTFALDGMRAFVGSFNFDPRSARLNTEMGFVIESPTLSKEITHVFDHNVPQQSYRVKLGKNRELEWVELKPDGTEQIFIEEPGTTAWRRSEVWVMSLLPIESLL